MAEDNKSQLADSAPGQTVIQPKSVRPTTLILALAAMGLLAYLGVAKEFLDVTTMGHLHFPIGPFLVLLVFVLGMNVLLRSINPRWALSTAQLVALWILTIVPFGTATDYMAPHMAAYHYYASPANNWDALFDDQISPPLLVQDHTAVTAFFEGLPPGQMVPWAAWIEPMVTWGIFAFASYASMLGLAVILRRRWVEQERFTFPLVQVVTEVAESPGSNRLLNRFLHNKLVWLAAALVIMVHSMRALHNYFPIVPTFQIMRYLPFTEPPLSYAGGLNIVFVPMMLGLSYVLTSEVAFSLWFFHLLFKAQAVIMGMMGMPMQRGGSLYGDMKWSSLQAAGGTIALFSWLVWLGRKYFAGLFSKAFGSHQLPDDRDEPLTYRAAILLFLISTGVMIVWLGYFGGDWLLATLNMMMGITVYVVLAWTVAQGGLFYVNSTFSATEVTTVLTGSRPWSTRALLVNAWNEWVFRLDLRAYLLPYLLNGFKISDSANLDKRSVLRAAIGPFLLYFGATLFAALWLRYTHGGLLGLPNTWLPVAVQIPFRWVSSLHTFPTSFQLLDWGHFAFGALATITMAWMRVRYSWFHLHPIGFIVASGFPTSTLWLSLLIGWLIKSATMRWGGYKAYRALRPFFLGLIIGEALAAGLWNVVGYLTGEGYTVIPF